ncbi:hypothetical protein H4582DRAFT_1936481 [Lactarius indigo]|nr:hypothetical protein H4582DRAFT_1936481 [Lactarius indigo]
MCVHFLLSGLLIGIFLWFPSFDAAYVTAHHCKFICLCHCHPSWPLSFGPCCCHHLEECYFITSLKLVNQISFDPC